MKLEKLIINQNWSKLKNLLKTKRGLKELASLTDSRRDSAHNVTPLVLAIFKKAPAKIIQTMLDLEPSLLDHLNNLGMNALHLACSYGSSSEVIHSLLQYSEKIHALEEEHVSLASSVDARLMTPLHHLVLYICYPYIATKLENTASSGAIHNSTNYSFQFTRGSFSRTIIARFSSGEDHPAGNTAGQSESAVHSMVLSQEEFEDCLISLDALLYIYPNVIYMSDKNGKYPIDILHDYIACKRPDDNSISVDRARLLCKRLRSVSINLYLTEKAKSEQQQQNHGESSPSITSGDDTAPTSCESVEVVTLEM